MLQKALLQKLGYVLNTIISEKDWIMFTEVEFIPNKFKLSTIFSSSELYKSFQLPWYK